MSKQNEHYTIGLLGQPNSGKSTLFNRLTGMHQHVGNWPGKTVAKKEGTFNHNGKTYKLVDLPGTYSFSPNSEEEKITRDFILSGQANAVVAIVDASQFERSLYLLTDFLGIDTPVTIALNMVDVAAAKGKQIDHKGIETKMGIHLSPMVAVKGVGIQQFLERLEQTIKNRTIPACEFLHKLYKNEKELAFTRVRGSLTGVKYGPCRSEWIAEKLIGKDPLITKSVKEQIPPSAWNAVTRIIENQEENSVKITLANCKYEWINLMAKGCVINKKSLTKLRGFEKAVLHPVWGKFIALGITILVIITTIGLALPFMLSFIDAIPVVSGGVTAILTEQGAPLMLVSFFGEALIPATFMAFVVIVFIISLVFIMGLLEEIGYLARIAFLFDNTMGRLGLQGKSVMPVIMGFACNIVTVSGSRIIASWKQRTLTSIVGIVVPCMATWGVVGLMSGIFFGEYAGLIIIALLIAMAGHMYVTSKIFSWWLKIDLHEPGLIMELPPYHKPNWQTIFLRVWLRVKGVIKKALPLMVSVSSVFWFLSYTADGNPNNTIFYQVGSFIEPVSMVFGMDWRLFVAFLASSIGKEAALGVVAVLFGAGAELTLTGAMAVHSYDTDVLSQAIGGASGITAPMALGFIFAYYFNVPCIPVVAVLNSESRSIKWTVITVLYYFCTALLIGGAVYRLSLFFL